ncbi:MAG: cytochrome c3 family protein [Steroidobacterales bacterium]
MKQAAANGWIALIVVAVVAAALAPSPAVAAGAAPITVSFDHLTTGFELDGVHRDLPCEACHLNAVFRGTPLDCGTCHITGSPFNATPKTATHISSTNNCAACHNTISFRPDVHFDHAEVLGSCVSCHNGTIAQGEGPNHPATSQNCAACHAVMSWNPPKMVDHSQIPQAVAGLCIVCHNGVQASGKSPGHEVTNLECGDCHTTSSWLGANFDHTGIRSGCVSCHNGTKAVGKQASHMATTNLCENCHTTGIGTQMPSWVPSAFDHTQMSVTTCQTCHNGTVKISTGFVSGQPSNHVPPVPSSEDCSVCHGNKPAAETWTVLAVSIPMLHAGLKVNNCLLCHAGETFAGVPAPYIPMSTSGVSPTHTTALAPPHIPILSGVDCSSCHAAAYQVGGFGPATAMSAAKHSFVAKSCVTCHEAAKSYYTGSGTPLQLRPADHLSSNSANMVSGDCAQCHTTIDWTSTALPVGHMPDPGQQACNVCHIAAPGNYTTLASVAVLHTGISGNCGQCHGNTITVLTWFNNFTPKDAMLAPAHIPYLAGTDCSSCHAPNYVTGGFGPMNMTQGKHAFVPTACDTCHEAGLNFFMGAASPALQGRPADHTVGQMGAPNDCSLCHTTANWNSNALPAGHMPNPANTGCPVCHASAPADYSIATLAAIPVLHTGISGSCGLCHGGASALTWYNNYTPKDGVLAPLHIPYLAGSDCSSCHAANYIAGGFGPTNMSAAKHAFVPTTCDTCHEAGLTFYLGASTPALQGRPPDHLSSGIPQQVTGDCSGCHETTDWNSTALPAGHMPNPGGQACTVCHIAVPNYATLASIAVLHTGITSGCAQCHGATSQLTFYNNNDNPKDGVLTPPHIPYLAGSDCSSCHAANYVAGGFGPTNMSAAKHAFVPTTCDTCHEAGLGGSFYLGASTPALQGRPPDHTTGQMVAPNDCSICHTTANWNSTALPAGHMPNPASDACTVCHTTAPADYSPATLAANSVLHTGISGNCGQCHGGTTALTWYNNFTPKDGVLTPAHIPYLSGTDCSSCHSSSTYAVGSFGPMNMTQPKHAFVTATCTVCHEKGLSFYMGAASPALQGRPADHTSGQMVAPNDCSICHTTANWNSTAMPAGHMPNPANTACSVCHTTAPADYSPATLAANPVLHTGLTSGCITCHGSPAGALTFYNNFTPKSAVLAPVHIPTATTPCEDCHSPTTFTAFSGTTMSAAKHTLMFAFIGSSCDACHNKVTPALSFYGVTNLQTRPGDHNNGNKATADCSGCHSPNDWGGGAQTRAKATVTTNTPATKASASSSIASNTIINSASKLVIRPALGALQSAQAGSSSGSAPASGVVSDAVTAGAPTPAQPSVVAHVLTAPFSHVGVAGSCVSCHNAVAATGKGPTHIASSDRCENCHTTIAWLPARFDHQGVSAACASCHNGVVAVGKPVYHVSTNQDCSACHSTIAWRPARFSHLSVTGTCLSCHNSLIATGKPLRHVATALDCASCHNTTTWTTTSAPPAQPRVSPAERGGRIGPGQ